MNKTFLFLGLIFVGSVVFFSCEENVPTPIVDFTLSKSTASVNEEIKFTNNSLYASSYSWDFGDGISSTDENPIHTYTSAGNFTITLLADGPGGGNTSSKNISISFPTPVSDFNIQNGVLEPGELILFKNQSKFATSYLWDFGDGNSSTDTNPSHTFNEEGTFEVQLTAKGEGGESKTSKTITLIKPSLNGLTTANFNSEIEYGTMEDLDGNVYKTVKIGDQIWMAENLRTTTYNDGTPIPNLISKEDWQSNKSGGYSNYNNFSTAQDIATYGRLYNGYAVNSGKLAPDGWHVPSDEEWQELGMNTFGFDYAGGRLKEKGTTHWDYPNTRADNASGFTAVPGGEKLFDGSFRNRGAYGYWWSSSVIENERISYWEIFYSGSTLDKYTNLYFVGYSVRLIKD